MVAAILIALCCQQADRTPAESLDIHFEAWRPRLHGGMKLDKAFGVDFLKDDEEDPGTLSFRDDAGFEDAANAGRISIELLPEIDFGQAVTVTWARWKEEETLTENEDMGGGTILPAGTPINSRLSFWSIQSGFRRSGETPPWHWTLDLGGSWFLLYLKGHAPGGEFRSRSASVGPSAGVRISYAMAEFLKLEGWGRGQIGFIADGVLLEAGLRVGVEWAWGALDVGCMILYGIDSEEDGFAMTSPTIALNLRF